MIMIYRRFDDLRPPHSVNRRRSVSPGRSLVEIELWRSDARTRFATVTKARWHHAERQHAGGPTPGRTSPPGGRTAPGGWCSCAGWSPAA
jgi:hypothetical protein